MDTIKSRGRIIAGVSFDIAGMGYKNPRTGLIEGFEADLARAIADKLLGAPDRLDFFQVTDEQRIPALQSDLVDMVLSQITMTPDRVEQVDFPIPYLVTREALLVPKGSSIKSFDDRFDETLWRRGQEAHRRRRGLPDAAALDGRVDPVFRGRGSGARTA